MPQSTTEKNKKNISWQSPISAKKPGKEKDDLEQYGGDDRIVSSAEWLGEHDNEPAFLFSLKSRIPRLDRAVDGFRDGELITISGFTKMGKTLLAKTFTDAFVKQQFLPLWFTYEVPTKQFLSDWKKCPLFWLPRVHMGSSMSWFLERCEESFLKNGTRIIFIDHLHYLFDLARTRSPSLEIGQVVRTLKMIATRNSLLIFLLCHTSKNSDNQEEPTYHDLRDSSFMAQESDSVLMIHRLEETNQAKLWVEFHRRTGVVRREIPLQMQETGLLGEMAGEYREEKAWKKDDSERRFP